MIKVDASENPSKNADRPWLDRAARQPWLPRGQGRAMRLPQPDSTFHWTSEGWGDALRCRPLDAAAQHVFTSRQLALPDDAAWRAALASVGATPDRLMRVKQVHGNTVRVLKRGAVPDGASSQRPEGDAIVSNETGLALAVMVADCLPILLCDPLRGAAAAIHAGWRGTCARVAQSAVTAMQTEFGCDPAALIGAIGPSAGPGDYEVGASLIEAFLRAGHARTDVDRWFIQSGAKPHLDLWSANRDQLVASGVQAKNIHVCGLSTVSHPGVFDSYRVDGERAGRMAGLVVVPASAKASTFPRLRRTSRWASLRHQIHRWQCTRPAMDAQPGASPLHRRSAMEPGAAEPHFVLLGIPLALLRLSVAEFVVIGALLIVPLELTAERFTTGWAALRAYPRLYGAWLLFGASLRELRAEC